MRGLPSGCGAILFVDGDCILCRRLSRLVINADSAGRLRVAPLAGVTARSLLSVTDRKRGDSVVLVEGTQTLRAADAVVHTLQILGGRFNLLALVIRALPGPARGLVYRFVARQRRAWFGHVESCPLPESVSRPHAVLD